jgi:CRISPR-associated protein Cas1
MQFNVSEMAWPGRVKHPATDPLNALLSLTYTLIMNELCALLEGAGLDPYLGFLHQVDYGRPSLALDLLEAFRHAVADRLVLTLVNKRMLEAADFQSGGPGHGVFLEAKAMRRYFAEYERWMLSKTGQATGFRECLRGEVEKLCGGLRGGGVFEPWRFRQQAAGDGVGAALPAAGTEGACNTLSATT